MSGTALDSLAALDELYREEGLQSPSGEEARMEWVGTCLSIAGVPVLIGAGEMEEIIETPRAMPIPGTKPWVVGVGSHMGGLLPIVSGDVFFRQRPYAGRVRDYCMVLKRPGYYFGITLSDIERDRKFPLEERDMEHPVDEGFAPFTLGGFHDGERFLPVLDIDKLIADSDLANAAAGAGSPREEHSDD